MSQRLGPAALSSLDQTDFTERLAHIFEHSPWVAERAWTARPFRDVQALHEAMVAVVEEAGVDAQLALLRLHPELVTSGPLTAASVREQDGAGLGRLDPARAAAFAVLNRAYGERFGFPFIIAVRGQRDAEAIRAAMEKRLAHGEREEQAAALAEVYKIARFRLADLVDATPADFLTVHVLDTARGAPARGLNLTLMRDGHALGRFVTNEDGRCDAPLLSGTAFSPGIYEIVFDIEAWRAGSFYDRIVIRFRVGPASGHLHIPLLLAPYGYSTYRGS